MGAARINVVPLVNPQFDLLGFGVRFHEIEHVGVQRRMRRFFALVHPQAIADIIESGGMCQLRVQQCHDMAPRTERTQLPIHHRTCGPMLQQGVRGCVRKFV